MEVSCIAQQLGSVVFTSDLDWVALEDVKEVGKGFC